MSIASTLSVLESQIPFDEEQHSTWDPLALTEVERRVEAAWVARRAARVESEREAARSRVRTLPRKREVAA